MARRNFVNGIVTKVQMGDIYRMQFEDLSEKVDRLLEQGQDNIAEAHKSRLIVLDRKIKECEETEAEFAEMIERACLTPVEYLLFDLRYMQNMKWNDIIEKIRSTPQLGKYIRSREVYSDILNRAIKKIKAAGE